VITDPEVFKSPHSDTYVVFGEAKIDDFSTHQLPDNVKQFQKKPQEEDEQEEKDSITTPAIVEEVSTSAQEGSEGVGAEGAEGGEEEEKKKPEATGGGAAEGVEAPEGGGVKEKEIELVMSQTTATRAEAIAALQKSGGDIVTAIMQLTY